MPNPQNRTPDDVRDEVAAHIRAHAGTPAGTYRAIQLRFGIGKATIGVIADEYGLADAWEKGVEQTQAATKARKTYLERQRSLAQEDLIDLVADLTTRFHDDVVHLNVIKLAPEDYESDEDNGGGPFITLERVEKTVLPPGPAEWRATAGAIASLAKAHLELARHDKADEGTGQAIGLLDRFEAGLREAREARQRAAAEAEAAEAEAAEGS